ncbi:hypothetical protein COL5a_004251 [Colletotrichum fioriniae]|nr:hypothetical protein COL5a_004251 [Colletotrichum fioriniae]
MPTDSRAWLIQCIASGGRHPHDSYYNGRPGSFRPESGQIEMGSNRQSHYDQYQNGGGHYNGGNNIPYRQRVPRTQTDPHMNGYARGDQNIYPLPNKDRSYETVTSAAASGSSGEHAGYHTDPTSSDNSSIERGGPARRPEPANDYGIGFSQDQGHQASALKFDNGAPNGKGHAYQAVNNGAQVPQQQSANVLRRPVGASPPQQQQKAQPRPAEPAKRKSWFSKRFSKSS